MQRLKQSTKITGVLTKEEKQYVFIDTPGLHKAKTHLGNHMIKAVNTSLNDIDVVLLVVEAGMLHAMPKAFL